jgi:hypothetical protein
LKEGKEARKKRKQEEEDAAAAVREQQKLQSQKQRANKALKDVDTKCAFFPFLSFRPR